MKKLGFLIFLAALVVGLVVANIFSFGRVGNLVKFSMDFAGVRGSGNVVREKRDISGFKKIEVGGGYQVEVVAGQDFSVEIEADDNLLSLVTTEVKGETLEIGREKGFSAKNPLRIRISAPDISAIDTSGGAGVTISGINNTELNVSSSGGSRVTVSGETRKLTVDMSGGAKILAAELIAGNAQIDGSGGSSADVRVTGDLNSDISGGSRVTYTGTPLNIVTNKSGAARVSQK